MTAVCGEIIPNPGWEWIATRAWEDASLIGSCPFFHASINGLTSSLESGSH